MARSCVSAVISPALFGQGWLITAHCLETELPVRLLRIQIVVDGTQPA
jgi:hypothetical protein